MNETFFLTEHMQSLETFDSNCSSRLSLLDSILFTCVLPHPNFSARVLLPKQGFFLAKSINSYHQIVRPQVYLVSHCVQTFHSGCTS